MNHLLSTLLKLEISTLYDSLFTFFRRVEISSFRRVEIKKQTNAKQMIQTYVRQPRDHKSWATPIHFKSINSTNPRTNQFMKFSWKISRSGRTGKWGFIKAAILLHLNENKQPVYKKYHLFLHYGWFLQNLWNDFIQIKYAHDCTFDRYC